MLTALLLFWPALAGLLVLLMKGEAAKKVAFGAAVIEFLIAVYAAVAFEPNAATQFEINQPWIQNAGINFHIGMDGISLLLVLLTTFLVPLIILSTFKHLYNNAGTFYALILFMQTGMIGSFVALDAFVFYVFWEVALIPIYFICGIWGGERRVPVTFKFFIYTIFGSLFMLAGFIYLYFQTPGAHSSDIHSLYQVALSPENQSWVFWLIFIAFAIKIPIFPFHTWQPDTYTEAPTTGTMLLSGIMLKMGIYGVIRWLLPVVPDGAAQWSMTVIALSVIGIIYGAIIAIRQNDMKRLVAFSSISHVGLIAAGLFTFNIQGLQGAMVQMLSHGINVVGMFFLIDIIFRRMNTREITALGGITQYAKAFTICFMTILLGTVALPLTNGFVGEFLLLAGVFQYNYILGAIAGITIILGAVYMFCMFQKVMFGEANEVTATFKDLSGLELAVLIPLIIMVFWIGLFPNTFLNISEPAVQNLLTILNR